MRTAILTTASLAALVACLGCSSVPLGATYQEVRDIPAGKALVYLYRPHLNVEYAVDFDVVIENVGTVTLADGSYIPLFVSPGVVNLAASRTAEPTAVLPLSAEAGKTYYVSMVPVPGILRFKPTLTPEPVSLGRDNIVPCRQVMQPPKPER